MFQKWAITRRLDELEQQGKDLDCMEEAWAGHPRHQAMEDSAGAPRGVDWRGSRGSAIEHHEGDRKSL